ncbi:MAG TPA: phosphohydrolase, partial [Pilimelia sp.]|nr:phosphohydrolase [Pilimelia sp.]
YLNHLLRVAIRIIRYYGVADPDVIVAALLHDAVEDHPAELAALARDGGQPPAAPARADAGSPPGSDAAAVAGALAVLGARYGARAAGLVAAVTNPAYDPARDAHEQYREHVVASLSRDPWARVIKISDFTDNAVGAIHSTGPKVAAAARKYRPLVPALRELIARPDTPLSAEAKQHIYGQLELAEERLGAILDG